MKKKRINPYRKPATLGDIEKIKREISDRATGYAMALFFTVMLDKEGASGEDLHRIFSEVEYLADSVKSGRVSLDDLTRVLDDEYGITIAK